MLTIDSNSFPGAREIMPALLRLQQQYNLTFTLLGAGARNILLSDKYHGNPAATKDADFAVFALSMDDYEKIKDHLIQKASFTAHSTNALTLISPSGYELDLLPFGPIEVNHEILLSGVSRAAQVHGLQEAADHSIPCAFEGKEVGQVVSLAGLRSDKVSVPSMES